MFAKEFIETRSLGDEEKCLTMGSAVIEQLKSKKRKGQITALEGRIVHNEKGIEEAFIFFDYRKITKGVYPFIYIAVQIEEDYTDAIVQYLNASGFVEINPEDSSFRKQLK